MKILLIYMDIYYEKAAHWLDDKRSLSCNTIGRYVES